MSQFGYQALGFGAGGSAAAAASESDIEAMSPVIWFDARAESCFTDTGSTAVTSDGDLVQEWHDRSDTAIEVKNATAAQKAVWKTGGAGDNPYCNFPVDASDKSYRRYFGTLSEAISAPMTMYVVHQQITALNFNGGCFLEGGGGSEIRTHHQAIGSYANALATTFGSDGTIYWGNTQSNDLRILQFRFPGDALPTLRINGGTVETVFDPGSASAAEDTWCPTGTNKFTIGKYSALAMNLYDWIGIPNTTHDQDTVLSYLGTKYGITVEAVA